MRIVSLSDVPAVAERFAAASLIEMASSSLRAIRLTSGQDLSPREHGASDLLLCNAAGTATRNTENGTVLLPPEGSVAVLTGDEELRAADRGDSDVTLLAFLPPPFPAAPLLKTAETTAAPRAGRPVRVESGGYSGSAGLIATNAVTTEHRQAMKQPG